MAERKSSDSAKSRIGYFFSELKDKIIDAVTPEMPVQIYHVPMDTFSKFVIAFDHRKDREEFLQRMPDSNLFEQNNNRQTFEIYMQATLHNGHLIAEFPNAATAHAFFCWCTSDDTILTKINGNQISFSNTKLVKNSSTENGDIYKIRCKFNYAKKLTLTPQRQYALVLSPTTSKNAMLAQTESESVQFLNLLFGLPQELFSIILENTDGNYLHTFAMLSVCAQVSKDWYRRVRLFTFDRLATPTILAEIQKKFSEDNMETFIERAEQYEAFIGYSIASLGYNIISKPSNADRLFERTFYLTHTGSFYQLWYFKGGLTFVPVELNPTDLTGLQTICNEYIKFPIARNQEHEALLRRSAHHNLISDHICTVLKKYSPKKGIYTQGQDNNICNNAMWGLFTKLDLDRSYTVYQHQNKTPHRFIFKIRTAIERAKQIQPLLQEREVAHYFQKRLEYGPIFLRADQHLFNQVTLIQPTVASIATSINSYSVAEQVSGLLGAERSQAHDSFPYMEIVGENIVLSFPDELFPRDLAYALKREQVAFKDAIRFTSLDIAAKTFVDGNGNEQKFVMRSSITISGKPAVAQFLQFCGFQQDQIDIFLPQLHSGPSTAITTANSSMMSLKPSS